jgi:hypothetical protein
MSDLWLVIRTGVYRHEVMGAFTSSTKAFEAVAEAKSHESDDHHSYEVLHMQTDVQVTQWEDGLWGRQPVEPWESVGEGEHHE